MKSKLFTLALLLAISILSGCGSSGDSALTEDQRRISKVLDTFESGIRQEDINKTYSCLTDPVNISDQTSNTEKSLNDLQPILQSIFRSLDFPVYEMRSRQINVSGQTATVLYQLVVETDPNYSPSQLMPDHASQPLSASATLKFNGLSWKISSISNLLSI